MCLIVIHHFSYRILSIIKTKLKIAIKLKNTDFYNDLPTFWELSTRYNRIIFTRVGGTPRFPTRMGEGTPKIRHDSESDSGLAQWRWNVRKMQNFGKVDNVCGRFMEWWPLLTSKI